MKLLKEPLTPDKRTSTALSLRDFILRILITKDNAELNRLTGCAHEYISILSYNRFLELQNKGDKE